MLEKVLVFRRKKSVDQHLWHVLHGNVDAAFLRKLGYQSPVSGVYAGNHRRLIVRQLVVIRQIF